MNVRWPSGGFSKVVVCLGADQVSPQENTGRSRINKRVRKEIKAIKRGEELPAAALLPISNQRGRDTRCNWRGPLFSILIGYCQDYLTRPPFGRRFNRVKRRPRRIYSFIHALQIHRQHRLFVVVAQTLSTKSSQAQL